MGANDLRAALRSLGHIPVLRYKNGRQMALPASTMQAAYNRRKMAMEGAQRLHKWAVEQPPVADDKEANLPPIAYAFWHTLGHDDEACHPCLPDICLLGLRTASRFSTKLS